MAFGRLLPFVRRFPRHSGGAEDPGEAPPDRQRAGLLPCLALAAYALLVSAPRHWAVMPG